MHIAPHRVEVPFPQAFASLQKRSPFPAAPRYGLSLACPTYPRMPENRLSVRREGAFLPQEKLLRGVLARCDRANSPWLSRPSLSQEQKNGNDAPFIPVARSQGPSGPRKGKRRGGGLLVVVKVLYAVMRLIVAGNCKKTMIALPHSTCQAFTGNVH